MRKILKKLIITNYSRNKYTSFKRIFHKLEKKHNKKTSPLQFLIGKKKKKVRISRKYLYATNTKKGFKVTSPKKFITLLLKDTKKKIIILPVHIDNKVHSVKHLNILVINLSKKTVTRIESTSPKKSRIKTILVTKSYKRFFKQFGFKYLGIRKGTKYLTHHGMCRFATPLMYLYSKNNYSQIKKAVVDYSKFLTY